MAAIIVKSDEQKAHEARVMRSFGVRPDDKAGREQAECIAARSREAYNNLRRMEEKHR